jgi:hypothetical protein
MNDDNHQSVVTRDCNDGERGGERVIKKYLSDLIKTNKHIDKALLISVIEQYVFKNTFELQTSYNLDQYGIQDEHYVQMK